MKPLLCENNLTKGFVWYLLENTSLSLLFVVGIKFGVNGVLMFVCFGGAL